MEKHLIGDFPWSTFEKKKKKTFIKNISNSNIVKHTLIIMYEIKTLWNKHLCIPTTMGQPCSNQNKAQYNETKHWPTFPFTIQLNFWSFLPNK